MRYEAWFAKFQKNLSLYEEEFPPILKASDTDRYLKNDLYKNITPEQAANDFLEDYKKNLLEFDFEKELFFN